MMILAAIFGVTSVIGGLYLCVWLDSAGAIMLVCTLQFLVVLIVAQKYGLLSRWIRLRNLVPQQVVEDVLTTILRTDKPTPMETIKKYAESGKKLDKALKQMINEGLLKKEGQCYALTAKGRKEAQTVLRAHRLWEIYLTRIGTPEEDVHATAHPLEPLEREDTFAYLEKRLGQPKTDPHGRAIPEKN